MIHLVESSEHHPSVDELVDERVLVVRQSRESSSPAGVAVQRRASNIMLSSQLEALTSFICVHRCPVFSLVKLFGAFFLLLSLLRNVS